MTEQEKRIAIAEAHGWKVSRDGDAQMGWHIAPPPAPDGSGYMDSPHLPDYLHDLNAMHEALMSQSRDFRSAFAIIMDSKFDRYELEAKDLADIFIEVLNERRQPAN